MNFPARPMHGNRTGRHTLVKEARKPLTTLRRGAYKWSFQLTFPVRQMSDPLRRVPRQNPATASQLLAGQAVVVEAAVGVQDGRIHELNEVATLIWELSDGTRPLAAIVHEITERFDVDEATAARDALEFAEQLALDGLLTFSEGPWTL